VVDHSPTGEEGSEDVERHQPGAQAAAVAGSSRRDHEAQRQLEAAPLARSEAGRERTEADDPEAPQRIPGVTACLSGQPGPVVAV
jgi:hypothetical protein